MEALREEVTLHQQDHQHQVVPVGFQQEVPVRPDGRPGQSQGDDNDGYLLFNLYRFLWFFPILWYFNSILGGGFEEDDATNQTCPHHMLHHATSYSFVCNLSLRNIFRLTNTLLQALSNYSLLGVPTHNKTTNIIGTLWLMEQPFKKIKNYRFDANKNPSIFSTITIF